MRRYEDESGELVQEVREASSDEVKAVVDAIDFLLHVEGLEPPEHYEDEFPLIPIGDNMKEFGFKRKGESSLSRFRSYEVAQVRRVWKRPDIGPDAEKPEVIHLLHAPKGFKAIRESVLWPESDPSAEVNIHAFRVGQFMSHRSGVNTVTARDCADLVGQLHATRVLK